MKFLTSLSISAALLLPACAAEDPDSARLAQALGEPGNGTPVPPVPMFPYESQAPLLQPPPGCVEIAPGTFRTGPQLSPRQYWTSPTFRATPTGLGDPAVADLIQIRVDGNTPVGAYSLSGENSNTYTCDQCVYANVDSPAGPLFVAESGTLALASQFSRHQQFGALFDVTLRQAVPAAPFTGAYTGSELVPGGACYWIRYAPFSTIRNFACTPEQDAFMPAPDGYTCVSSSYAGDDGTLARADGAKTQGEACTRIPATAIAPASSDCAEGYACTSTYGAPSVCMRTCDFLAEDPGCGAGLVCGVYGLCVAQSVMEPLGFLFDPAELGEACSVDYAEFCGREGARGMCHDDDGDGFGTCVRYVRARSECTADEDLGYVYYSTGAGGYDRSYGFCYPR